MIKSYLQLLRPANTPTVLADIIAGYAASYPLTDLKQFILLMIASVCLYTGGIVLNDAFDASIDAKERPERPIPSGKISLTAAFTTGLVLLCCGVLSSFFVSKFAFIISVILASLILLYDMHASKKAYGFVIMGLLRAGNMMLAVSAAVLAEPSLMLLSVASLIYISGITFLSRYEVHGRQGYAGLYMIFLTFITAIYIFVYALFHKFSIYRSPAFLLIFLALTIPAFYFAYKSDSASEIKKAVGRGVLAIIALDACWVSIHQGTIMALITLSLLLVSVFIKRYFEVT